MALKTTSPVTRIPGKLGPPPTAPKSSMPTGTPGVRQGPSPWSGYSFNAEKAVQNPAPAVPAEGVSAPPLEAKPLRPLEAAPVDSWPILSRSGDEPDEWTRKSARAGASTFSTELRNYLTRIVLGLNILPLCTVALPASART